MIYVKKGISIKTNKVFYAVCLDKNDKTYYLTFDKITICNLLGCSFDALAKLFADIDKIEL